MGCDGCGFIECGGDERFLFMSFIYDDMTTIWILHSAEYGRYYRIA